LGASYVPDKISRKPLIHGGAGIDAAPIFCILYAKWLFIVRCFEVCQTDPENTRRP
jgi:hypothetical protein